MRKFRYRTKNGIPKDWVEFEDSNYEEAIESILRTFGIEVEEVTDENN